MNLQECFDTILQLLWLIPSILQHAIQNTQKVFFSASNSILVSRELCSISNKFKPSKCFYYNGLV